MHSGGFIIDKITDCIIEVKSGKKFETEISRVTNADLKTVLKKNGWNFNWRKEFNDPEKQVYKLKAEEGDDRIQGLISVIPRPENLAYEMILVETAPHNFGRRKLYDGVLGNLVAYVCKMSFEMKFGGVVYFIPKNSLIQHYRVKLRAEVIHQNRMAIYPEDAMFLKNSYFKNFDYDRT
ncbi:hypothetical protein HHL16_18035 [Pseudoflavitalea sp. G-6-1-2]|uniref:hypothetical protein n=1 Tax=Pseudoflavitalea sp. G-6-1-2 TaxID=2728841 RepID=UPI00146EF48F|nr:hypothetical protein [Pseudoflavitalea sp. G-6-1-2]NML22790.1 hypothetical protein [Pseudoflavitalea sp. G-6-1-2]